MIHKRGWLLERIAEARIAVMSLTRLPAGRIADPVPTMAAASWAFPCVGVLIGSLSGFAYAIAITVNLPAIAAALIAIAVGTLASGALHEDGLADYADGLGGGRDAARKLEIMRDSRIGTYGVLALLLAIALRSVCLAALIDPMIVAGALIALAVASRSAVVAALYVMPPARADGLGHSASDIGVTRCLFAAVTGIVALIVLTTAPLAAMIAIMASGAIIATWAWRQIGGQTGDVLGAIQQVTELAGLMVLVAYVSSTAS